MFEKREISTVCNISLISVKAYQLNTVMHLGSIFDTGNSIAGEINRPVNTV